MIVILEIWIILAVAWWLFGLNNAREEGFQVTFGEAAWMLGVVFVMLPLALIFMLIGAIEGVIALIKHRGI